MHNGKSSDQAQSLRRMTGAAGVDVIAVTGGKGGVGKTCASINLAVALADEGQRVLLLDADLGLANVDVMLGLHPRYNLSHVLNSECSLEDIVIDGPGGIRIVPAASGRRSMTDLCGAELAGLITAFGALALDFDTLIVDTAAGIANSVVSFAQASQNVVVVVCDEPASITDSYALIKVLSRDYRVDEFQVLTNMTADSEQGKELFAKLARAAERFLDTRLIHFGNVTYDDAQRRAIQRQSPVSCLYPSASTTLAYRDLARKTGGWRQSRRSRGRVEFFAERLIRQAAAT